MVWSGGVNLKKCKEKYLLIYYTDIMMQNITMQKWSILLGKSGLSLGKVFWLITMTKTIFKQNHIQIIWLVKLYFLFLSNFFFILFFISLIF